MPKTFILNDTIIAALLADSYRVRTPADGYYLLGAVIDRAANMYSGDSGNRRREFLGEAHRYLEGLEYTTDGIAFLTRIGTYPCRLLKDLPDGTQDLLARKNAAAALGNRTWPGTVGGHKISEGFISTTLPLPLRWIKMDVEHNT